MDWFASIQIFFMNSNPHLLEKNCELFRCFSPVLLFSVNLAHDKGELLKEIR